MYADILGYSSFPDRIGNFVAKPMAECNGDEIMNELVEIADDAVFTVEYSIRAAQLAVNELLYLEHKIPQVTPNDKSPHAEFQALRKGFK